MDILFIGGTGFLGSHIVNKLIERNHNVTIITRNHEKTFQFDKSKVNFINGDILKPDEIIIINKPDVLVYTAMAPFKPQRISNKKFKIIENITYQYFKNTFELAKKLECPLIITLGASYNTTGNQIANEQWPIARVGMAAVGKSYDTMAPYYIQNNKVQLIEMLPAQIYGDGGMFSKILNMAKTGKIVILGNGKNYLPRVHVSDCADAYVLAIEKLPVGKRFIVCDDENVTVKQFMLQLAKVYNVKRVIKIPKLILRFVMGKHIYKTLTINTKLNNQHIKTELGWQPKYKTYKQGLTALVN